MSKNAVDDDKYIIKTQEERDAEATFNKRQAFNKMIDDLVLNNLMADIKMMDDLGATGKMAEAWDIAGATIKKAAGFGYIKGKRDAKAELQAEIGELKSKLGDAIKELTWVTDVKGINVDIPTMEKK